MPQVTLPFPVPHPLTLFSLRLPRVSASASPVLAQLLGTLIQ